jgi:signal transduction histidine kinase
MNSRRILGYELLILIPTLVAGIVLFQLLGHERERLERARIEAAEGQALLTAKTLDGAILALQAAYTAQLLALPTENREDALRTRMDQDPLIRHVFISDPVKGLLFPHPDHPTGEEALFVRRYESLFTGREPFRDIARPAESDNDNATTSSYNPLRELSKSARLIEHRALAQSPDSTGRPRSGWMPWFWESRLHWLGWVRPADDSPVYGVELETAALLAYLLPSLQKPAPSGMTLVLRDGNGQPVHQQGTAIVEKGTPRLASMPVGPGLPHWTVDVFSNGTGAGASGRLFMLLSTVLTLIFMLALLTGGMLLAQQARRDRLDAARKTSFVSNVSHEFKTPLTTLRMYAELLAEERIREPEAIKRYLGVMIRETERLTRLVNNVLDFSRLEQGRRSFNLERFDAAALAQSVLDAQLPRLQEAGLALDTQGLDVPAPARADRDALSQILLNLLDNAVKYAVSGKSIHVSIMGTDGRTRLVVEDHGPGISPAHRARLFEPFHRADDALTATQPGTGLGLSISRRLLRDMGGDLLYEPAPGGGARFILELPS